MFLFVCNACFMVIYCGNQNIDNKRITTLHVTSVKNIHTTALEIVVVTLPAVAGVTKHCCSSGIDIKGTFMLVL